MSRVESKSALMSATPGQIASREQSAPEFWSTEMTFYLQYLDLLFIDDGTNGAAKYSTEAKKLIDRWAKASIGAADYGDAKYFSDLYPVTVSYLRRLLVQVERSIWLGAFSETFLRLVIGDLTYAQDLLEGKLFDQTVGNFWNDRGFLVAGLLAHLLDPSEATQVAMANYLKDAFLAVPDEDDQIFYSVTKRTNDKLISLLATLRDLQEAGQLRSTMRPSLIQHLLQSTIRGNHDLDMILV